MIRMIVILLHNFSSEDSVCTSTILLLLCSPRDMCSWQVWGSPTPCTRSRKFRGDLVQQQSFAPGDAINATAWTGKVTYPNNRIFEACVCKMTDLVAHPLLLHCKSFCATTLIILGLLVWTSFMLYFLHHINLQWLELTVLFLCLI